MQRTGDNDGGGYYADGYYGGYSNHGGYGGYGYGGYGGYGDTPAPSRSIKDYLVILRERIWWIIASVVVVLFGVIIATSNTPPTYRSSALVQVLRQNQQIYGGFEDIVNLQVRDEKDLMTQVQLMRSASMARRVQDRLRADELRQLEAPFSSGLFGGLNAGEILIRRRNVVPVRSSMMVSVEFTHPEAKLAARVANLFAQEFIAYNQELRIEASMSAVEEMKIRADQQRNTVEDIELRLAQFKERYKTVSFDTDTDIERKQLDAIDTTRTQYKQALDEIETQWRMVQQFREQGKPLWNLGVIANDSQVSAMRAQLDQININIAQLAERYGPKHDRMVAVLRAKEQALEQLDAAVDSVVERLNASYRTAQQNLANVEERIAKKQQEIIDIEKIRIEYRSLLRNLSVAQALYQSLYSQMQTQIIKSTENSFNARIVDPAGTPPKPYKPDWTINLTLGVAGGFAIGLGLAFLVAFIDDRVKTSFDIETAIGLPLVGLIPRIKSMANADKAQAVSQSSDKHTLEAFRAVHSTLNLTEESKKAKCMLVTSTIPGEGKSFVVTNLATTYANHGERTIIIDCDLRMPNVAKSLQISNDKGVIDYFDGDFALDDLIVKNFIDNLDILPTGGRARNPTQIIHSERFEGLIHELRMRYDRILIDSPPLAPVSDSLNILPLVDGVLYVIKFNSVKRKTAKTNVRRLWESNVPVFGAVLNNISSSIAGYYYSNQYDKSYKDYYIHDDDELDEVSGDLENQTKGKPVGASKVRAGD